MTIYPKMSQEDIDKFKKDLGYDIILEGVSINIIVYYQKFSSLFEITFQMLSWSSFKYDSTTY